MLENMPLSGYAFCYGPLALVILGFIVFASITDAHARRTYLRRLDPRPETERPDDMPFEVTRSVRAQTPAGMPVTIEPAEKSSVVDVIEPPPSTAITSRVDMPLSVVETPRMVEDTLPDVDETRPSAVDISPSAETPSNDSSETTNQ